MHDLFGPCSVRAMFCPGHVLFGPCCGCHGDAAVSDLSLAQPRRVLAEEIVAEHAW